MVAPGSAGGSHIPSTVPKENHWEGCSERPSVSVPWLWGLEGPVEGRSLCCHSSRDI